MNKPSETKCPATRTAETVAARLRERQVLFAVPGNDGT